MIGRNRTKALGGGGFLAWWLRRSSGATASGGGEGMEKWSGECVGPARGAQDAADRARASTARGLRAQVSGDGWRHAASSF